MYSFGSGLDTRDYTYITDVVSAIEKATVSVPLNTEINISGNCETNIKDLILNICNVMDIPINMTSTSKRGIDTITRRWLDCTKAFKLLGWEPKVGLDEGLRKTIEWSNLV